MSRLPKQLSTKTGEAHTEPLLAEKDAAVSTLAEALAAGEVFE